MLDQRLLEIVVRAAAGEQPDTVAAEWTRRLSLPDGVRVAVNLADTGARPRRFVVYNGQVTTPQRFAALSIRHDVEDVVRRAQHPTTAWDILQDARSRGLEGSTIATATMATITQSARILVRAGHLKSGPIQGTWVLVDGGEAAAA